MEIALVAFRGDPRDSDRNLRLIATARFDELAGEHLTDAIAKTLRAKLLRTAEGASEVYPWHTQEQGIAGPRDEAGIHNARTIQRLAEELKVTLLGNDATVRRLDLTAPLDNLEVHFKVWREPDTLVDRRLDEVARAAAKRDGAGLPLASLTPEALLGATDWRERIERLWSRIGEMQRQSLLAADRVEFAVLIGRGCKLQVIQESALAALKHWRGRSKVGALGQAEAIYFDPDRAKSCVAVGAAYQEGRGGHLLDVMAYPMWVGSVGGYDRTQLVPSGRVRFVLPGEVAQAVAAPPAPAWDETVTFAWDPATSFDFPRSTAPTAVYANFEYDVKCVSKALQIATVSIPAGIEGRLRAVLVREEGSANRIEIHAVPEGKSKGEARLVAAAELKWV